MKRFPSPRRGIGRLMPTLAILTMVTLSAAACNQGDAAPTADDGSAVAPSAQKASEALEAGLKAHAAGDLAAAADFYDKTLKYDATNPYAFYNLALIDESAGNYGLAEANYRSALDADPDYGPALFNLAILRTAADDPKEAISLYRRAVTADKKDAAAWLNLGLLLRENGAERRGDENVLRALALDRSLNDPAQRR